MTTNKENPTRNHIHIPALGEGHLLIDGHPVRVKAGSVEIHGVGNPHEITAVTLTIFPETITIDGDLKDA